MKERLVIITIMAIVLMALVGCKREPTPISKEEMILAQFNYNESIESILDEMIENYSDYISYNNSENKFKSQIDSLIKRYDDVDKIYQEFKATYFLKDASVEMQEAINGLEKSREYIKDILVNSIDKGRVIDRDDLLILYIENFSKVEELLENFIDIVENDL